MSNSLANKRLTLLSIAIVLISPLIIQSGYTYPIEAESLIHLNPSTLDHNAPIAHIVKKEFEQPLSQLLQPSKVDPSKDVDTKNQRNKKKKKKKKKFFFWGEPPKRQEQYQKPIFSLQSVSEFSMEPFDTPWRHRMIYSLEWNTGPHFLDHIRSAQRDNNNHQPLEETSDTDNNVDSKVTTRPLFMDVHLVPFDLVKSNELLLSRVPVSSGHASIQVRSEIPPGWYRLEIRFWDEGSQAESNTNTENSSPNKPWGLVSDLIISPGHEKPDSSLPREVGIWRGKEAIEITTLSPEQKEWSEFVETISQEADQDRWSLREFTGIGSASAIAQRQREQRKARLEQHQREEEFRMPNLKPDHSRLHDHMKTFLSRLWSSSTKTKSLPKKLSYERTQFPQESFRFNEDLSAVALRPQGPDYFEDELELMDEMDKAEELREQKSSYLKQVWEDSRNELGELMTVWKNNAEEAQVDEDGMDEDESYGAPPVGLSDLRIRIGLTHHDEDDSQSESTISWRANRDRAVSWEVVDSLVRDEALLSVELIKAPSINHSSKKGSSRIESRAELIQGSLAQESIALLTDRIPASWGAIIVRMPSWVLPGVYQLRLSGMGNLGMEWADVSQPFTVQSDPYLYS